MYKLAIGLLVAAMALAACGGSSKKSVNPAANSQNTTANGGSTAAGSDDLSKLAAEYAKAKIKITYTSTSSGDNSTITIAQDGNGKSAFTTGDSTFYSDGTSSVSCQGTGSSAECTDLGSAGAGAGIGSTLTSTFAALAGLLSTLGSGHKSSDTIAGRDASCVTYTASEVLGKLASSPLFSGSNANPSDYDPNDTATICIDKQSGFVLKFSSTKKGVADDALVATDVSEPTDADFTPPVTPKTLPSIPSIPTVPAG